MNWRDVPIPKKMRALTKDRRGYPIPFVIMRDRTGCPHFTVNDSPRMFRVILEARCQICGGHLGKPKWFVGGPGSAFHPDGGYLDGAMHYECMTYAMKVCPYLAAPKYLGRIDDATVDYSKLSGELLLLDPSMIPDRPALFVAVATTGFEVSERENLAPVLHPHRPYVAVEYWQHGVQLSKEEAEPLVTAALRLTFATPLDIAVRFDLEHDDAQELSFLRWLIRESARARKKE